jgi:hypothetical protein
MIDWMIGLALFFLIAFSIFFSIRQRWPERFIRWVRR